MPANLAEVALPVPLPGALTYSVPERLAGSLQIGVRVRAPVGKRKLIGVVTGLPDTAPEGIQLRDLSDVVDRLPVLSEELLELARFAAAYYLAPLGEVIRTLLPSKLPAWGERSLWLTDGGALASPRDELEANIVEVLLRQGQSTLGELQALLRDQRLVDVVDRMVSERRLRDASARSARGHRYVRAVEVVRGDRERLLERCGKSTKARSVVDYLISLERPATVSELIRSAGCGKGVITRLVKLGILREFTQIEHLSLDHHLLKESATVQIRLRDDQAVAVKAVLDSIDRRSYSAFLLAGMTGSGKTEVYLRGIEATLGQGRGAIVLVPEIGLVPALAAALRSRFGEQLAILHSNLRIAERAQEWERIRRGDARVVLGPRSALFAPMDSLALLVIDEEHDDSYKQDSNPRYHGRDLGLVRARLADATAVLVSATPSLESRHNVDLRKLEQLTLTTRVGHGRLPEGILVDLRRENVGARKPGTVVFSQRLREEITKTVEKGRQVILLRNRRGYSPVLLCRACGEDLRCDDCGLPRTYHRREAQLLCHYCGSRRGVPRLCPACGEAALEPIGSGTERVEETFAELFPGVRVAVLDRDTARRAGGAPAILQRFGDGKTQVLIGTQMVSKGHHFPGVELTGILSADTYLGFPDFRAVEKTYALLTQLAGRAGRGEHLGRVVIQTYHPNHYAIRSALAHDDAGFAEEEMRFRRVFGYPPYSRMVQLRWSDKNRDRGRSEIRALSERCLAHPMASQLRITGPAPAPLERLRARWRFQLILRAVSGTALKKVLSDVLPEVYPRELIVDVDPHQLL